MFSSCTSYKGNIWTNQILAPLNAWNQMCEDMHELDCYVDLYVKFINGLYWAAIDNRVTDNVFMLVK